MTPLDWVVIGIVAIAAIAIPVILKYQSKHLKE